MRSELDKEFELTARDRAPDRLRWWKFIFGILISVIVARHNVSILLFICCMLRGEELTVVHSIGAVIAEDRRNRKNLQKETRRESRLIIG